MPIANNPKHESAGMEMVRRMIAAYEKDSPYESHENERDNEEEED